MLRLEGIDQPRIQAGCLQFIHEPIPATAGFHGHGSILFQLLQIVPKIPALVLYPHRRPDLACLVYAHEYRITGMSVTTDILFHAAVTSLRLN